MQLKLIALIFMFAGVAHAAPSSSPEMVEVGRKSFATNCAVCHGDKGLGDGVAAAGLNPKPRNLAKDPFKNGASKDKIFETISKGLNGTTMRGFPELSEKERWSLVYFVLSLRGK
jgi:mono/diheme cytochrome c family protein